MPKMPALAHRHRNTATMMSAILTPSMVLPESDVVVGVVVVVVVGVNTCVYVCV
jgi:hypothetical protein